jgi:hypothetical protein
MKDEPFYHQTALFLEWVWVTAKKWLDAQSDPP